MRRTIKTFVEVDIVNTVDISIQPGSPGSEGEHTKKQDHPCAA